MAYFQRYDGARDQRRRQLLTAAGTEQKRLDNAECIDLFTDLALSSKVAFGMSQSNNTDNTRLTSDVQPFFFPSVGALLDSKQHPFTYTANESKWDIRHYTMFLTDLNLP